MPWFLLLPSVVALAPRSPFRQQGGGPSQPASPGRNPKRFACASRRCWPTWFDTSKLLKRSRSISSLVPASSFLDQPHIMPSRAQDQKCPFYQ
jgi:hypothetical protein